MPPGITFSVLRPGGDRMHHVSEPDIRLVLDRLPPEVRSRLRAVHLNDQSRGARVLGYVNQGRREIAICALPPRVSLARFMNRGVSPVQFGATRGSQWSPIAIRRYLLYDVFLHELGHLQIIDEDASSIRRKFGNETKAQDFADFWRKKLWSEPFDHLDPVHNPPTDEELADPDPLLSNHRRRVDHAPGDAALLQELGRFYLRRNRMSEARQAYEAALALRPNDPWNHLYLGNWHYAQKDYLAAIDSFTLAAKLIPNESVAFWCLGDAYHALGSIELADVNYRKAVAVDPADRLAKKNLLRWRRLTREVEPRGAKKGVQIEKEEYQWVG